MAKVIREDQMPSDPVMRGPWYGSVSYALGRDDVLAAFREQTGIRRSPAKDALSGAIDQATGADFEFISAFVDWHNEMIWGDLATPAFSDTDLDALGARLQAEA